MDKQDELATVVCMARLGVALPGSAEIMPSDDDIRIAAAVRSFMGSDEVVERAASAIVDSQCAVAWSKLSDRDQSLERSTARAALSAAIGEDIGGGRG